MTKHYMEIELFRMTIQKLTFAYSFPLTTLYEFSFRCKRPDYMNLESLPSEENTTGFKRYGRILERVCTKTYSKSTATFLLSKPKIYDRFLFDSQKKIYNSTANKVGYKSIENTLSSSLIKSAAFLDEATPDYDTIVKEYPYYVPEKRDGVSFLEFVLLINIDLVVNGRALDTLNRPIVDKKSEKLAKKTVDKIISNIKAPEMFSVYVHAFFDVLDAVSYKLHNLLAEQNAREIWLPSHYLQRKDIFRALNTHIARKEKTLPKDYEETQIDSIVARGNMYDIMRIDNVLNNYNALEYLGVIFVIAFFIIFEYEKGIDEINLKGSKEYLLAKEYAEIIKEYIYNTINAAEEILKRIYVDNDSPLRKEK